MNASFHYTAELFYKGQDNGYLETLTARSAAQARSKFKELAYYRNMDLGQVERNDDYEVCGVISAGWDFDPTLS
jgi:hypothetical protein